MSAIRALRQLSLSSSRAFATRSATRSVARAALAARVAPVSSASRAFSVSARRLGEGACELSTFLTFLMPGVSYTWCEDGLLMLCGSRRCAGAEAWGGTEV